MTATIEHTKIDQDTVTLVLAQLEMFENRAREIECEPFLLGIESAIEVVSWLKSPA